MSLTYFDEPLKVDNFLWLRTEEEDKGKSEKFKAGERFDAPQQAIKMEEATIRQCRQPLEADNSCPTAIKDTSVLQPWRTEFC